MDKRLSIALLLTAIIVAVTPILFPTPRKATPSSYFRKRRNSRFRAAVAADSACFDGQLAASTVAGTGRLERCCCSHVTGIVPTTTAAEITIVSTREGDISLHVSIGAAPVSATLSRLPRVSHLENGEVILQSRRSAAAASVLPLVMQRDNDSDSSTLPFSLTSADNTAGVIAYSLSLRRSTVWRRHFLRRRSGAGMSCR